MRASLPMYDFPETRDAADAWWAGLAAAFRDAGIADVPDALSRGADPKDYWAAPDLFLSQTCGYPYTHDWSGYLRLVATPAYAAEGCDGADYCSFVLVRAASDVETIADLRGARAVYNGTDSQSGYSALRAVVAPFADGGRFFGQTACSGAHLSSMADVAEGRADVCAVDAVVWALARRHRPGLPYVTSADRPDDLVRRMRAGVRAALVDEALAAARNALLIEDVVFLAGSDYRRILDMEAQAVDAGYPCLET